MNSPVANDSLAVQIRAGYELIYDSPQPRRCADLNIHHTRAADILVPDRMLADPPVPTTSYYDGAGNWCTRLVAPPGRLRLTADALLKDSGLPDPVAGAEYQHAVEDLPEESLVFLLGSRYCETDRLTAIAWNLFGTSPTGARRIKAICDYVHRHIAFSYQERDRREQRGKRSKKERGVPRPTRNWRAASAVA